MTMSAELFTGQLNDSSQNLVRFGLGRKNDQDRKIGTTKEKDYCLPFLTMTT